MPVSHLGLTVSHIASATSFYLAALQPLGYRFIGHQGDSIGFGVDSADFFLTQAPTGARPSPNHIAFLAEDRNAVRDCYTASLNAGGLPSGTPSYRNDDCSCFNAAVEDLDGNTVEFIYRRPHGEGGEGCDEAAPADSQVNTGQQDVPQEDVTEDARSATISRAESTRSQGLHSVSMSNSKSRMTTALDLAKGVKSEAPSLGASRVNTVPTSSGLSSNTIIGTALGAVAGAALMFAMTREEAKNAREEAEHLRAMAARSRSKSRHSVNESRPRPPVSRPATMPPAVPAYSQPPVPEGEDSQIHRHNYSTTESLYSRPFPRSTQAMRMIEATGHNENNDVQEVMSRYTNLRPHPTRERAVDAIEEHPPDYVPRSQSGRSSKGIKRSNTLPVDSDGDRPHYYLEAPKSTTSRHSRSHYEDRDDKRSYTSHRSHRRTSADDAERLKRHDSGVSMHSSRFHRDPDRGSEAGKRSSTWTIKPSRRSSTQDAIPLPPPPMGTYAPSQAPSRGGSSCYHPAAIELPPSVAGSKHTTTRHRDANPTQTHPGASKHRHLHEDRASVIQSWEDFESSGSSDEDGLGDMRTVLPEDSISCVDLSKPRRKHRHREKGEGSRRSEGGRRSVAHSGRRTEVSESGARRGERKERKTSVFGLPIRGV